MGGPALAVLLALLEPAAAFMASPRLSSSAAAQRGHDSDMVPRVEPTQDAPNVVLAQGSLDLGPPPPDVVVPDMGSPEREVPDRASSMKSSPLKIPLQLVLMAREGNGVDDLPRKQRDNVEKTLALNPELEVRFLNDTGCGEFINRNFGGELATAFEHESVGYFRGDICRAAVIAIEGGFYADLDVQFRVPFSKMVDSATTFMSAFDSFCNLWNAILAAEPHSDVMYAVIDSMKSWYRGYRGNGNPLGSKLMGTNTFYEGLDKVVRRDCGRALIGKARRKLQFECGERNAYRLYRESPLDCGNKKTAKAKNPAECPDKRKHGFHGLRFGIFEPGANGTLVGWSRFEDCTHFGCNERRSGPPPSNGTDGEGPGGGDRKSAWTCP